MAYPNIFPIEPGRDGWKSVFASSTDRLLHLCGLIPTGLKSVAVRGAMMWEVDQGRSIPSWVESQETRPLRVSQRALINVLRRVGRLHDTATVRDILKAHGDADNLPKVKSTKYREVYMAALAALDRAPRKTQ